MGSRQTLMEGVMALNIRQTMFITELKNFASMIEQCIVKGKCLKDCYDEEFADGLDNALINQNTELIQGYAFDSDDIKYAVTESITNLLQFWVGNAVPANDYGKLVRRIK